MRIGISGTHGTGKTTLAGREWLDDAERDQIFAGNVRQLFKLCI